MRRVELQTPLPAPVAAAWAVFVDTPRWPEWGRLVVAAEGEFSPGHQWTMLLEGREGRPQRVLQPHFVSMVPGEEIVFQTVVGAPWIARMVHRFRLEGADRGRSVLRQDFEVHGGLVWLLWPWLHKGMRQFSELGLDLQAQLASQATSTG